MCCYQGPGKPQDPDKHSERFRGPNKHSERVLGLFRLFGATFVMARLRAGPISHFHAMNFALTGSLYS